MDHETLRQPQPALHTGQQVDVHCQCFRGPLSQALQLLSGTGVGCNDIGCGWGHRYWWATSLSLLTTPSPCHREKVTDPHHSQPTLSILFSCIQKLLAFLANTSIFSNHTSPSPPPLGPHPQSFSRDYAKGLHKRWREGVSPATQISPISKSISV